MRVIKVAGRSRPTKVAGAIAGIVREEGQTGARAIGARAVNQAIKGVIVARKYLAQDGIDVICIPVFTQLEIGGLERTAITLIVEPR
ncbi:MAG: stage V sporulation protein S [Anaerolineae bacterium]|nr:MAG: stage V sporulation protein S [Anaerolineae bacterium]